MIIFGDCWTKALRWWILKIKAVWQKIDRRFVRYWLFLHCGDLSPSTWSSPWIAGCSITAARFRTRFYTILTLIISPISRLTPKILEEDCSHFHQPPLWFTSSARPEQWIISAMKFFNPSKKPISSISLLLHLQTSQSTSCVQQKVSSNGAPTWYVVWAPNPSNRSPVPEKGPKRTPKANEAGHGTKAQVYKGERMPVASHCFEKQLLGEGGYGSGSSRKCCYISTQAERYIYSAHFISDWLIADQALQKLSLSK